jgi:hypothetical protein
MCLGKHKREHRAIRWQQVGDTAAALRSGEVGN